MRWTGLPVTEQSISGRVRHLDHAPRSSKTSSSLAFRPSHCFTFDSWLLDGFVTRACRRHKPPRRSTHPGSRYDSFPSTRHRSHCRCWSSQDRHLRCGSGIVRCEHSLESPESGNGGQTPGRRRVPSSIVLRGAEPTRSRHEPWPPAPRRCVAEQVALDAGWLR
jgi:hypothetical protein